MIHAYAANATSQPLKPFEYPTPMLGSKDVEIAIDYCGLCYSDVHMIDNDWKISRYPRVPGHEIIGRVVQKGQGVKNLELGERVGVGWQCGACLSCEFCIRGEETVCTAKVRTCVERHGGFANAVVIDSRFVYPIPPELDSASAAPLLCAGITVYSPFKIYTIAAPMSVAVVGIGGLGHLALQFARAFGCQVTALSTSPEKKQETLKLGAHHFVSLTDPTAIAQLANTFDFIVSTVHADLDWALLVQCLRPRGKLCFVGIPSSEIKIPARLLVSGNRSVCGSGTGSRTLMREMLQFAARHRIQAQIELFPMAEINQAILRLRANQARYRIVLHN